MLARRPALLLLAAALALGAPDPTWAHGDRSGVPAARAVWTATPPVLDGRLDDPVWARAPVQTGFVERKPGLRARPPVATSFRVLFDRAALYVAVRCDDIGPDAIFARTRTRDSFNLFRDDAISLKIDPGHDHRTTLGFAVNPLGARLDYRGINESEFRVEFDAVWDARAARDAKGWTVEFQIPWTALGLDPSRLPARMGFNVTRDHSRRNATYDWVLIPPPYSPIAASRYGHLEGLDAVPPDLIPPGPGGAGPGEAVDAPAAAPSSSGFALVPYAIGGFRREPPRGGGDLETGSIADVGLDALADFGAGWRGQLTLNTDFAQVDLDDQVANLTRFGLFFPEKRDFFLRELEVFAFGQPREAQLLHTRRIGLQQGQAIPILGGLKLVGRIGERVRVGMLGVSTRPDLGLPWTSQTVLRALVELEGGSNVGLMLTQRQSYEEASDRNSTLGLDGAWRDAESGALIEAYGMLSMTGAGAGDPEVATGGRGTGDFADRPMPGLGLRMGIRGEVVRPSLSYAYTHPELRADLGFLRRVGVHEGSAALQVEPRIGKAGIEKITFDLEGSGVLSDGGDELLDWSAGGGVAVTWDAGYRAALTTTRIFETVLDPFPVAPSTVIPTGGYAMTRAALDLSTPSTWWMSAGTTAEWRDFYGGRLLGLRASVSARPAPLIRIELAGDLSRATFPGDDRPSFTAATVNGRVALGFTPDLGLDLFTGWNRLSDQLQVQSRLRWTWAPGSDLFVVYQHDAQDDTGRARFQSLVLKLTYHWAP